MKKEDKVYQLDRSHLQSMTFGEADDHVKFWENRTETERLNAACSIINQIFGITSTDKIDVRFTDKRKHPNG